LAAFRWRHTRFQGLKHRVSDLAKDVELQLLGSVIRTGTEFSYPGS
jgi:hypothetical protein